MLGGGPKAHEVCYENSHKSFVFIARLLRYEPIFMLGVGPKAHEV